MKPVEVEAQTPDTPTSSPPDQQRSKADWISRAVAAVLLVLIAITLLPGTSLSFLNERLQTFTTIFLGIFIEAVPFLLLGSLVSGLIAVFVDSATVARYAPRRAVPAAITGALMGFAFPVCECGVVPVTRRLYQKGLP
ncbi:MAG: permease, partial [Chloroflexota bacterium]